MTQKSFVVSSVIIGLSASLLTYIFSSAMLVNPLLLNEIRAEQDAGSSVARSEGEVKLASDVGGSSEQCPANQHMVGSTNQCEWDNCGLATPPMFRNTQTGRCVSDCSEVGQSWVKQGNICVLGSVSNETSPSGSSISIQEGDAGELTDRAGPMDEPPSDNASSSLSNLSSPPSTITQTLVGEPSLPYSCFSNTFTCYCDGSEGCTQLTSSGECKAEVRNVEGKPGLGQCDWNARP
jgi:hypothetical protein